MKGPFEDNPQKSRGLGSRLLGRRARGEAARELEALLASAGDLSSLTAEEVDAVVERHGLDLMRLRSAVRDLYRRYLEYCLVDRAISETEALDLAHLRGLLRLDGQAAAEVQEEVACAVYGAAIDEVLADHRLDGEEEAFLRGLRAGLELDEEAAEQAFEDGRRRARQRYLSSVVSSDDVLLVSQEVKLELEGLGETIDAAVAAALEEAATILPRLEQVEITRLKAEIEGGKVARWRVKLKTVLDRGG